MVDSNLFQEFSINAPYKFILYCSGVIFILNLFLPLQIYDKIIVQAKALWILMWGVTIWFFINLWTTLQNYYAQLDSHNPHYNKAHTKKINWMTFLIKIFQLAYIIITIVILAR
jgi:hypothetical protein